MSGPYDTPQDGKQKPARNRAVRPKDAATLILVRRDAAEPRLLMGKRSGRHDFMPDKYVFPGGRVDPEDGRAPALSELRSDVEADVRILSRRTPRAFGLTAIRETFEETGLIVGEAGTPDGTPPANWKPFLEAGAGASLNGLHFIGRAVTPPYRPKRFDARFFMAEAEEALLDERPAAISPELVDVRWVNFADALKLDLPSVTRFMIGEIKERLEGKTDLRPAYLRWTRSGHAFDRL